MNIKAVLRQILVMICAFTMEAGFGQSIIFQTENIFPFQGGHVHGSTIIELPNSDLLVGWFQGSGERWADDVKIMGSRKKHGQNKWSEPFVLADAKEFPDCNPILFLDVKNRLWIMWYTVLANQWETSLLRYKISEDYTNMAGAPKWMWQSDLLIKAGDKTERGILPGDSFVTSVREQLASYGDYARTLQTNTPFDTARWNAYCRRTLEKAQGKDMIKSGRIYSDDTTYKEVNLGYPYFRRMGWQSRNKAVITATGRLIVPLYSDGFSFSLMAYTDDSGENWKFSDPLVAPGNIQPSIAKARNGDLVAYMRDNGPAPKRLHISRSKDNGQTWSPVRDTDFPNPGSAADVVTMKNGHWILIYNDLERGRNQLSVALSEDEGKTWPWHKRIENGPSTTQAHYPAIVEGHNGILYASYSYFLSGTQKTIKSAAFNEKWIKSK